MKLLVLSSDLPLPENEMEEYFQHYYVAYILKHWSLYKEKNNISEDLEIDWIKPTKHCASDLFL